jgi:GTP-binding protein Era
VSAETGEGVSTLLDLLVSRMPEGPALFPADEVTDQSIASRIAELVREQALRVTHEEVPHSVAVVVEELEPDGDLTRIDASIVVERESQKGILIGHGGETLKRIGSGARPEIEALVGTRVYLGLHVKVMREWQRDPKALDRLGL